MNHVSIGPTDGNGPTQGQRKTLTKSTSSGKDLFPYLKVALDVRCLGMKLNHWSRNANS